MGGKGGAYSRLLTELWDGTALCGRGLPLSTHRALGWDYALWAGLTRVHPTSSWIGLRSVGGAYPCPATQLLGRTAPWGRGLPLSSHRAPKRDHALWAGLTPVYPPSSGAGPRSVGGAYLCSPPQALGREPRSVGGASPGGGTAALRMPFDRPSHPGTSGSRACRWRYLEPERLYEGVGGLVRS